MNDEEQKREAAKVELRRREWASRRGIATRAYIRENPSVVEEFAEKGDISIESFPSYVTKASVLLELHQRANRRDQAASVKQWKQDNPEEAAKIKAEVARERS